MNTKVSSAKEVKISRLATIIIFLALIRCIAEVFRLQYYSEQDLFYIAVLGKLFREDRN